MAKLQPPTFTVHEDPDLFREALNFTAVRSGFVARLIEKDYYSTVLLVHLAASDPRLAFKGGTCLAKVHAGFYRLSEDLDFAISLPTMTSRNERRRQAERIKAAMAAIPRTLGFCQIADGMRGANDSAQYNGSISYRSILDGSVETIKIEVSLREPLLLPVTICPANTLLLDPLDGEPLVQPTGISCIALREAWAEKFRAALTRREVAIRDFFDLDHAVRSLELDPMAPDLVGLVSQKLAIPGIEPVNVAENRLTQLQVQLQARLRPVLRQEEFDQFDLNRAFDAAVAMADALAKRQS